MSTPIVAVGSLNGSAEWQLFAFNVDGGSKCSRIGWHHTDVMRSVAECTRQATRDSVLALPVQARVDLALRLGDDNRRMLESSKKIDRETAVRQIRQHGRRSSGSMEETGG
jgi:hypothetical protein